MTLSNKLSAITKSVGHLGFTAVAQVGFENAYAVREYAVRNGYVVEYGAYNPLHTAGSYSGTRGTGKYVCSIEAWNDRVSRGELSQAWLCGAELIAEGGR
jgi:hypothetical protein